MIKVRYSIIFLLLIFFTDTHSQSPDREEAFDSIFKEVALNLSSSNPTLARYIADSLYHFSSNEKQKLRSSMLIADIYSIQERRNEAILQAEQALIHSERIKDHSYTARIYGFLATQYRFLGLIDKSKFYLQKVIESSAYIANKEQVAKILALAHHEMGDLEMEQDNFEKAREFLRLAILSYEKEKDEALRNFEIANALELMGRSYMAEKQPQMAFPFFKEAEERIEKAGAGNTLYAAAIYRALGKYFLENNNIDECRDYLEKALPIVEEGNHLKTTLSVYEVLVDFYRQTGDFEKLNEFLEKYKAVQREVINQEKKAVDLEYQKLENNENLQDSNSSRRFIIWISIGFSIIIIFVSFKLLKKNKNSSQIPSPAKAESAESLQISSEMRKRLIGRLEKFEKEQVFLQKDLSFSLMVNKLETNASYLRHILKEERGNKDFNTYINDLRIEYVLESLKNNEAFRKYKISYLAEISGFSSHSNFSANFRRVTELSPSEYIEELLRKSTVS